MMKKDCRWIEKNLIEIVDGSIESQDTDHSIEEHLRSCSKCTNLVRKFQIAWEMMGKPEKVEVSPGFEASLFEKIEGLHKDAIRNKIKGRLLKAFKPAVLTAGIFLALILGYHLGNFSKQEPVPMEPDFALEAGYQEYSSGDLTILDDNSRGSATDFLLSYKVSQKEDSP
jgi:predicted anti-sigma-YlaC factor YlaD